MFYNQLNVIPDRVSAPPVNTAARLHLLSLAAAVRIASAKSNNASGVRPSAVNIFPPDKPSGRKPSTPNPPTPLANVNTALPFRTEAARNISPK